jgi:hypothetical protein
MHQVRPQATSNRVVTAAARTGSSFGLLTSTFPFLSSARTSTTSFFSIASQRFFVARWSFSAFERHGNITLLSGNSGLIMRLSWRRRSMRTVPIQTVSSRQFAADEVFQRGKEISNPVEIRGFHISPSGNWGFTHALEGSGCGDAERSLRSLPVFFDISPLCL